MQPRLERRILFLAVLVLSAEACTIKREFPPHQVAAPASNDKQFIAMIHERGITTTIGPESEINAAHTVCGLMDHGQTAGQIAPVLQAQNPGISSSNAQAFVDSAIAIYCPQYVP
jgi:hypothetical protein